MAVTPRRLSSASAAMPTAGEHEGGERQRRRVEEGDDDDGAEIVDDGERQEEYLQRRRDAGAQQGQHADGEGDVGGGRNGPAAQRDRLAPVDAGIDQRRDEHAADRGDDRQRRRLRGR